LTGVEPRSPKKSTPFYEVLDWSSDGTRLLYNYDEWVTGGDCAVGTSGDQLDSTLLQVGLGGGLPTIGPPDEASQGEWSSDGQSLAVCGDHVTVSRRGHRVRRWPNHFYSGQGCFGAWPKLLTLVGEWGGDIHNP
jgi:hypothetical protein